MDERNYKWFLEELTNSHISFKILETGFCRGTKVVSWYGNTRSDDVFCRSLNVVKKTKNLLNYFLNSRIPILEEYTSDKLVCFLYHKTGKRLVSAKQVIELAENQLHGLRVTSVHMVISSDPNIYTVQVINEPEELKTEIFVSKFGSAFSKPLKDHSETEKIINYFIQVNELLVRFSNKEVREISMDLTKDNFNGLVLINITYLKFKPLTVQKLAGRTSSIKFLSQDSSSEESISEELPKALRVKEKNHVSAKKNEEISQEFLEMIGKTIDKDRKKIIESAGKRKECFSLRQISERKIFRERTIVKKSWDSMNELLFYLEKTRPKNWVQDSDIPSTVRNLKVKSKIKPLKQESTSARPLNLASKIEQYKSSRRLLFKQDQKDNKNRYSV